MSQTETSRTTERQTSRQRRIDEQRRRIEDHQRDQRRKRLRLGGIIVVAVVVIAAGLWLLLPKPVAAQGHQVPIEGNRQHMPQGSAINYRNRPPSSGDHYDQPYSYGVAASQVPTGNWVHNLEHGAVVVLYRPDLCDDSCVSVLRDSYNSAPSSQLFPGYKKMVVTPYTDMDHAVATVAWGWLDEMDAVDKDRVLAFYRAHVDHGPEQAL
jgi:hypothetical protein